MSKFQLKHSTPSPTSRYSKWLTYTLAGVLFTVISGSFILDSYLDQINNVNLSEAGQLADASQYPS
jgi:hypothetical protein